MKPLLPFIVAAVTAIVVRYFIPTTKRGRPGIIGDIIAGLAGSLVAAYFYIGAFEGPYTKLTTGIIITVATTALVLIFRKAALMLRGPNARPQHNHHHSHRARRATVIPAGKA